MHKKTAVNTHELIEPNHEKEIVMTKEPLIPAQLYIDILT